MADITGVSNLTINSNGADSLAGIQDAVGNLNTDKVEGQALSVDSEVAIFSGTGGKTIKRASSSGIAKLTSGVLSVVTAPSGVIVGDTDTQTLTNKTLTSPTLTTPTIASFTNATHDHSNAAGGGTLSATTAFGTGTVPTARLGSGTPDATTFLRGDQTWATPASGGGSVFVPAGAFIPGTNCTLTASGSTAWVGVAQFADGAQGRALVNVQVPSGATSISSIKIWYQDSTASALNLYLEFETAAFNTDTLGSAVSSDTNGGVAAYASQGTAGVIASVTVPSGAYNAHSVDAGDIVTMRINREGGNANDTYGTTWDVLGVEFTFA